MNKNNSKEEKENTRRETKIKKDNFQFELKKNLNYCLMMTNI